MEEIKYLEMFRDLKINKKELSLYLKGKFSVLKMRNIIEVSRENILTGLASFFCGKRII